MTTGIFSRGTSRRPAVAWAAALAGALVLTGCSDDGGSEDGSSGTPSASATGGASGSTAAAAGELEGSWLATADGKAVALIITGKQAALFATGGTVCSGSAGEEAGMRMIRLACTTGTKDRTTGMVDSVDAGSLKVTWEGAAGEETYTKAEGGQWPEGLPTAGLG
ncbi:hypothetical protein [Streptomyces sp. Amel2xC10]|uniref:hypothetical protein n=1 Tax=Streptomyces sp. Amel2xC10 TaxID=1305826 RepID=UPI000A082DC5|nr:hypothetical protein [Streptomyces sp. Amel2xC10]SMF85454.1 hypothetical protein SAMN02745830_06976 [Streptomyces sp. Amel2xC10]